MFTVRSSTPSPSGVVCDACRRVPQRRKENVVLETETTLPGREGPYAFHMEGEGGSQEREIHVDLKGTSMRLEACERPCRTAAVQP